MKEPAIVSVPPRTPRTPLASELTNDGAVIWSILAQPGYGLMRAVTRHRALTAVVLSTALCLLATGLILPHIDSEAVAADTLRPDMTPHERNQALETANKLYQVTTWGLAAAGSAASALLVAVALWLAFRVAGAKAGFKASFTVAAHALVPQALKALLLVPAVLVRKQVEPSALSSLLPSTLTSLLPSSFSAPAPVMAALGALDFFTLWSLVLLGLGMTQASGASRLRSSLVMLVLFAAYVAIAKVVPSAGGGQ